MIQTSKQYRVFRGTLLAIVIALVVQYVLGMFVNLYVPFPDSLPGGNAFGWVFTHSALIQVHIYLGTLLLVLPLIALGLSFALKDVRRVLMSLAGLLLIFLSYAGGMFFMINVQENAPSMWMAIGMIAALAVYGIEYYLTRPLAYAAKVAVEV